MSSVITFNVHEVLLSIDAECGIVRTSVDAGRVAASQRAAQIAYCGLLRHRLQASAGLHRFH